MSDPWFLAYERAADHGAVMKAACFGCMHCAPERFSAAIQMLTLIQEAAS